MIIFVAKKSRIHNRTHLNKNKNIMPIIQLIHKQIYFLVKVDVVLSKTQNLLYKNLNTRHGKPCFELLAKAVSEMPKTYSLLLLTLIIQQIIRGESEVLIAKDFRYRPQRQLSWK